MSKLIKKVATLLLGTMVLTCMPSYLRQDAKAAVVPDPNNGDWSAQSVTLRNTSEAQLMVRVGDIDNLGYGFGSINPFSGIETPVHGYPCNPRNNYPGTDKTMVVSGYKGISSVIDGYTGAVYNKNYNVGGSPYYGGSAVEPIKLAYSLGNITVKNARIQMFVDDIQPSKFKVVNNQLVNDGRGGFSETSYNEYEVYFWIEGKEELKVTVSGFEEVVNGLDQHGPIGKLITFDIPEEYLNLIQSGENGFYIKIDDVDEKATGYKQEDVYSWVQGTIIRQNDEQKFKEFFQQYYSTYTGQSFISDLKTNFKTYVKNYFGQTYGTTNKNYSTYFQTWFGKTTDQYIDSHVNKGTRVVTQEIDATGDGYAIDFVKLLINRLDGSTTYDATVKGKVYEAHYEGNELKYDYDKPAISDVAISFNSGQKVVQSNSQGEFICDGIPAGQAIVTATKDGYAVGNFTIKTLLSGEEKQFDIGLVRTDTPLKPKISVDNYLPTNQPVTVSINYYGDVQKKYRINGGTWTDYTAPFPVAENCLIEAKSIKEIQTDSNTKQQFESDLDQYRVSNIDKSIPPKPTLTRDTDKPVNRNITVSVAYPAGQTITEAKIKRGGDWEPFDGASKPQSFEVDRNMTVYVMYKNNYGNWSEVGELIIDNIDKIAPTATLSYKTEDDAVYNPSNWTNKNVTAMLSNFDSVNTTVTVEGGNSSNLVVNKTSTSLNAAYNFTAEAGTEVTPSVTFVLTDNAGNITRIDANAKIDKKAPTAEMRLYTDDNSAYDSTKWTNRNVIVELYNFNDEHARISVEGMEASNLSVGADSDGKKIAKYTISEPVGSEGEYSVSLILTDEAGNSSRYTGSAKIDKKPPQITISYEEHQDADRSVTASASTDSDATFEGPDTHTFTETGTYEFKVKDKAGNEVTLPAHRDIDPLKWER